MKILLIPLTLSTSLFRDAVGYDGAHIRPISTFSSHGSLKVSPTYNFSFEEFMSSIRMGQSDYINFMKAKGYMVLDTTILRCYGIVGNGRELTCGLWDEKKEHYKEYFHYYKCSSDDLPYIVERGRKDSYLYTDALKSVEKYGFKLINKSVKNLPADNGIFYTTNQHFYESSEFKLELLMETWASMGEDFYVLLLSRK